MGMSAMAIKLSEVQKDEKLILSAEYHINTKAGKIYSIIEQQPTEKTDQGHIVRFVLKQVEYTKYAPRGYRLTPKEFDEVAKALQDALTNIIKLELAGIKARVDFENIAFKTKSR